MNIFTFPMHNSVKGDEIMKYLIAFLIKFGLSFLMLYLILDIFYDMTVYNVFTITLFLSTFSFLFVDILLLPKTNNTIATINDFGFSLVIIWILSTNLTNGNNTVFIMSLFAAAIMAVFEYFFHKYFYKKISHPPKEKLHYLTEASEEFHSNNSIDVHRKQRSKK